MKKQSWLVASALFVAFVAVTPAAAQPPPDSSRSQASGGFSLDVHTHSSDDPTDPGLRFPTQRLEFPITEGSTFSYSSRPCELPAPVNQVGLNFAPPYPGLDNPVPVRHRSQGTIVNGDAEKGTIEGTITTVICETQNGTQTESEHSIITAYRGHYKLISPDEARIRGSYEIIGGTGTFENLTGHGSLQASLTCLRDATCAELGHFTDFVAPSPTERDSERGGLQGSYKDPDVTT
jgi:hypothetical protein